MDPQIGRAVRIQDAIGMKVVSRDQAIQGTIQDFVFSQMGELAYVAVGIDQEEAPEPDPQLEQEPPLQIETAYLVPVEQVQIQEQVIVQITREKLQQLDRMLAGELPPEIIVNHVPASRLQELSVVSQDLQELGRLEGAALNLEERGIEYIAVAPSDALGLTEPLYAVSSDHIQQIFILQNQLVLDISREDLGQMQGFSGEQWPEQAGDGGMEPELPRQGQ